MRPGPSAGAPTDLDAAALSEPFARRVLMPVLDGFGRTLERLTPGHHIEEMQHLLSISQDRPWPVASVVALQFIGLGAGGVLLGALAIVIGLSPPLVLAFFIAGGAVGFAYPRTSLQRAARRRREEIERVLPDFLDMISVTMEAGLTLAAALTRAVGEKDDDPLQRSVRRALREYQLGVPLVQSLRNMAEHLEIRSLDSVIRIMVQSERLGTGMAELLRIHAEQIRHQRRTRARELGQQASVKMLAPMMGCIFPVVLVLLLGPALVALATR